MFTPYYNKKSTPNWVFIDLDDTLWDFKANSLLALRVLYIENVYLTHIFASADNFINLYRAHNDRLWHSYHHGEIDAKYLKRERFEVLLRGHFPHAEAADLAISLNSRYLDLLALQTNLVPGALDLLGYLAGRYMIAVLSNGFSSVQYRKLYSTGLWRYVQRMVLSDEIGITKPDVRLFRHAERATGATAATSLMIGDNPDADIAGAIGAGWQAICFNRDGKGCPDGVTQVKTLAEIKFLL